jgi:hypothetical protein
VETVCHSSEDNSVRTTLAMSRLYYLEAAMLTLRRRIFGFCEFGGIFCLGFRDVERTGESRFVSDEAQIDSGASMTYTVRYWMGNAIAGSTSRRDRTLCMDMDPLECVRRKSREGPPASPSSQRMRSVALCFKSGSYIMSTSNPGMIVWNFVQENARLNRLCKEFTRRGRSGKGSGMHM